MVDISDIIGLLGDNLPSGEKRPSSASVFLDSLYRFIETTEEEVEPDKPNYLRASSLYKLCARRAAIGAVFPDYVVNDLERISAGQQLTFDLGHAVHEWVQNKYLGPMGTLWGHWFCFRCDGITHTGLMPKKCKTCGRGRTLWHAFEFEGRVERFNVANFLYVERSLVDNELGLTAHPDGLLYSSDLRDIQQVFELKTISTDGYDKLVKQAVPKPEHVIQTHVYMYLSKLRETYIVYFDKGKQCEWKFSVESGITPGAERLQIFHVEFDDELWAKLVADIRDYYKALKLTEKHSGDDIAPFKRICKSPTERNARDCPMRDKCFALKSFA